MSLIHGLDSKATVFTRVGWCIYYDPDRDGKPPVGGGAYNEDHVGHESFNFQPEDARCYGFVRTQGQSNAFNLDRIFLEEDAEGNGVGGIVVCVSRSPNLDSQVIVGWYTNATCLVKMAIDENDDNRWWTHHAAVEDCVLLPLDLRSHVIPQGKGGMGQSNVFYPLDERRQPRSLAWVDDALEFIADYSGPNLVDENVG